MSVQKKVAKLNCEIVQVCHRRTTKKGKCVGAKGVLSVKGPQQGRNAGFAGMKKSWNEEKSFERTYLYIYMCVCVRVCVCVRESSCRAGQWDILLFFQQLTFKMELVPSFVCFSYFRRQTGIFMKSSIFVWLGFSTPGLVRVCPTQFCCGNSAPSRLLI